MNLLLACLPNCIEIIDFTKEAINVIWIKAEMLPVKPLPLSYEKWIYMHRSNGTDIMCNSSVKQNEWEAEQQLVMQQLFIKRVENIRHFRSLASLTSGQRQKIDRQRCVRESALHDWLQLVNGNMFLIKGKLGRDNSMAYCHPEFIWQ